MYAVVGCSDCTALWVIEGRPDTVQCPRCGSRRGYDKRRTFLTTGDRDHAREVRASMLATRQGEGEAFAKLDAYDELERRIDEAGVNDREYLERSGVDAAAAERAGERAGEGTGGSASRPAVVRSALRELDRPDRTEVVAYAADRGVPADAAGEILDRLVRRGEALEDGGYRLL